MNRERTTRIVRTDPSLAEPLARWHTDHGNFARLLDLLELHVGAFDVGKQPKYELLRQVVYYLREYPDRFHHAREELAFQRLVRRDPPLESDINWCLHEHRLIADAGDKLLNCLDPTPAGVALDHSMLKSVAATYVAYYRHHIATEEHQIIPRAVELLTPDDWNAVNAIKAEPDPLFDTPFDARYSELRDELERMIAEAKKPWWH